MAEIDVYEIVKKLIGPIRPIGETHTDDIRIENLHQMMSLAETLIADISSLRGYRANYQYSMKRSADQADKFLKNLATNYDLSQEGEV